MSKTKIPLLISLCFVISCCLRAAGQQCARLQSTSPDRLVSYLSGVLPDSTNTPCIASAIDQLGDQRYEPAIPVLAKFLDVRFPSNARQKQRRFVLERDGASIYPAVNALGKIGKKSLPSVLEVIKADSVSRQIRENAVSVWMQIYKNESPVGVMLLKQEADRTKDPSTRQRVGWAAFKAQTWCAPSEQAQCQAALNTRYLN